MTKKTPETSSDWIPVTKMMPCHAIDDYWGSFRSDVFLLCNSKGHIFIGYLRWYPEDKTSQWYLQGRDGYHADDVTHWRELPLPPTEEQ